MSLTVRFVNKRYEIVGVSLPVKVKSIFEMALKMSLLQLLLLMSKSFVAITDDTQEVKGEKISLSVPKLSEEENQSNHMPKHLRCDACLAIVHQIYISFAKFREKRSSMTESDILEILENTCNNGFHNYGIKQVNKINRLSGPGLETESIMGMTQMGGRWSHRLQEMCHYYIGEIGEFDIYNVYIEGRKKLTKLLCYGTGIYGYCTQVEPSSKIEL